MTTQPREIRPGRQCPRCEQTHEACADARKCKNWRTSWGVCAVFGTRPYDPPARRRASA